MMLSMARADNDLNSGESSFSILLSQAPHLDQKYTIFGKLTGGEDVLKKIEALPLQAGNKPQDRLDIISARVR